jgi:hypothetical protein
MSNACNVTELLGWVQLGFARLKTHFPVIPRLSISIVHRPVRRNLAPVNRPDHCGCVLAGTVGWDRGTLTAGERPGLGGPVCVEVVRPPGIPAMALTAFASRFGTPPDTK